MKKILSFILLIVFVFTVAGCDMLSGFLNGIGTQAGNVSENGDFDSLDTIYQLAVKSGYSGSYDSWIQSLKGDAIELRVNGNMIQWHYTLSDDWSDLIDKRDLMGAAGQNGLTPEIGPNGHWYIGGIDTSIPATGLQGEAGHDGQDGQDGADGQDGLTPYVGENNNWWIGNTDTGVSAYGVGEKGEDGQDGADGQDGLTPYVGENNNWWIGNTDTGVPVSGPQGNNGKSVYELYKEAHPEYLGTEAEWLDDYINHRLEDELTYYTVKFDIDGETTEQSVLSGRLIEKPNNPVKPGHIFIGWYVENDKWNFELNSVFKNMTLKALFVASSEYSDVNFDVVSSSYESITYSIQRDTISNIESVTLYEGGSLVQTNTNPDVTSFDNVKSNTEYRLVLSYSYDLGDGMGVQYGSKETYIRTKTYSTPSFTLNNYVVNGTTISYSYRETDRQDRGSLSKVSLYVNGELVKEVNNPESTTIENVLSNTTYRVVLTYTYNLNDGYGEQVIEREFTITTPAKQAPIVSLSLDDITQNELKGSVGFADIDSTGTFIKVELYQGEDRISESLEKTFDFTCLTPAGLYTFKVSYTYDLNDGSGVHEGLFETVKRTHGVYEILSTGIINSSAIMEGDTIYLRIRVDNPSNAKFTKAIINGKDFTPAVASTNTELFFNIPASVAGDVELKVEELVATLDGVDYEYVTYNENTYTTTVYGKLEVKDAEFYVLADPELEFSFDNLEKRYYKFHTEDLYAKLVLNNPFKYDVDELNVNGNTYSSEEIIMNSDKTEAYIKLKYNPYNEVYYLNLQKIVYSNEYIEKTVTYSSNYLSSVTCLYYIEEEVIEISNREELISAFSNNNVYDYNYYYYKLTDDIDLSDAEWTPLPYMRGVFDGNGHTISGMTIVSNFDSNTTLLGLFKNSDGVFMNLNMSSVLIMSSLTGSSRYEAYVGAIVASPNNTSFINCGIDSNSTIYFNNETVGNTYVGGIAGNLYYLTQIINCYNESNITTICKSSESYVGGLIGRYYIGSTYHSKVFNSYNSGRINGNYYYVAGLFGAIWGDSGSDLLISNSFNSGDIIGRDSWNSGSLVSTYNESTGVIIRDCYSTGSVNGEYMCKLAGNNAKIINSIVIGNKYPNEVLPMTNVTYTFDTNGGSQIDSITGDIIELPTPIKEGYLFYGWYENEDLSGDRIDSKSYYSKDDCTLYAKYFKIVSLDEISSCISFEGNTECCSIGTDFIKVDIPADNEYSNYAYVSIRITKRTIISFNIEVNSERESYSNEYYYLISNYSSYGLSRENKNVLILNLGDYIRMEVQQRNNGAVMACMKNIVIAVEETE